MVAAVGTMINDEEGCSRDPQWTRRWCNGCIMLYSMLLSFERYHEAPAVKFVIEKNMGRGMAKDRS